MLHYSKNSCGLSTLLAWYGSAFPRTLPFSLFASGIAVAVSLLWKDEFRVLWIHPYPFQIFALVTGFMLVLRAQLGYNRFWEGRTQLQAFASKLTDVAVQALCFDAYTIPEASTLQAQAYDKFKDNLIHLISLLHAVGLATLRDDYNVENIGIHNSCAEAPPSNLFGIGVGEIRRAGSGFDMSPTGESSVMLTDAKRGSARPSSWRMSISNVCNIFSLRADRQRAAFLNRKLKMPVIAGVTQDEGTALGAHVTVGDQMPNINMAIHGVLLPGGGYAPAPTERPHTIHTWIQHLLMERIQDGGIKVASPLQARMHSVLSAAMLAYEQCKKLNEAPFPFPWAQAATLAVFAFTLTAPFAFATQATHPALAAVLTFLAVSLMQTVNEIARDIEDPFHYDPNQMPVSQMCYRLNERLLAISKTRRPIAFTDDRCLEPPHFMPSGMADASGHADSMTSVPTAQPIGDPPGSVPAALQYSRANPINPLLSESIDARIAQWGDSRRLPPPLSQTARLRSQTSAMQPVSRGPRQGDPQQPQSQTQSIIGQGGATLQDYAPAQPGRAAPSGDRGSDQSLIHYDGHGVYSMTFQAPPVSQPPPARGADSGRLSQDRMPYMPYVRADSADLGSEATGVSGASGDPQAAPPPGKGRIGDWVQTAAENVRASRPMFRPGSSSAGMPSTGAAPVIQSSSASGGTPPGTSPGQHRFHSPGASPASMPTPPDVQTAAPQARLHPQRASALTAQEHAAATAMRADVQRNAQHTPGRGVSRVLPGMHAVRPARGGPDWQPEREDLQANYQESASGRMHRPGTGTALSPTPDEHDEDESSSVTDQSHSQPGSTGQGAPIVQAVPRVSARTNPPRAQLGHFAAVLSHDSSSSSLVTTTTPSHAPLNSSRHGSRRFPGNGNGAFAPRSSTTPTSPGSPGSPQPPPGELRRSGALFQSQFVAGVQAQLDAAAVPPPGMHRRTSESSRPSMIAQEATTQSHSLELVDRTQSSRLQTTNTTGAGSGAITTSSQQHTSPLGTVRPTPPGPRRSPQFETPLSNIEEPSQPSTVEEGGAARDVVSSPGAEGRPSVTREGPSGGGRPAPTRSGGPTTSAGGGGTAQQQHSWPQSRGDPIRGHTSTSKSSGSGMRPAAVTAETMATARPKVKQGDALSYTSYMPGQQGAEGVRDDSGSGALTFWPKMPPPGESDAPLQRGGWGGPNAPPRAPSPGARGSGQGGPSIVGSPSDSRTSPIAKKRSPSPPGPRGSPPTRQHSLLGIPHSRTESQREQQEQQRARLQSKQQAHQRYRGAAWRSAQRAPSPTRDQPSNRPTSDAEPGPRTALPVEVAGTPFRKTSHLRPQSPPAVEPPRQAQTAASLMSPSRGPSSSRSPSAGRGSAPPLQGAGRSSSTPPSAAAALVAAAAVSRSATVSVSPSESQPSKTQPRPLPTQRSPEQDTAPEATRKGERGNTVLDVVSTCEVAAAAKSKVDYEPPGLETPRDRPKGDKMKHLLQKSKHKHIPMAANLGLRQSIYSSMPDSSSSGQA